MGMGHGHSTTFIVNTKEICFACIYGVFKSVMIMLGESFSNLKSLCVSIGWSMCNVYAVCNIL